MSQIVPIQGGQSRVLVKRGFFAMRLGQFGVCNPGDIVDISINDAKMVVAADKASPLDVNAVPRLDPNYVPERLKNGPELSPEAQQLKLLAEAVGALRATSEAQAKLIAELIGDGKGKGK